jgi:hypothetical protein
MGALCAPARPMCLQAASCQGMTRLALVFVSTASITNTATCEWATAGLCPSLAAAL